MTAAHVFKLFNRLLMLGGFAVIVWYVFFADRPDRPDAQAGQQKGSASGRPAIQGDGKMPEMNDGFGGKNPLAKLKEAASESGNSLNRQAMRNVQAIHLHLPSDRGSCELSESLAEIRMSWPDHLKITTMDATSKPELLAKWRVSKAPSVVFQTDGQRLYTLQEPMVKDQLAKKVEALIFGLVQVDKNWRPEVKGLERN